MNHHRTQKHQLDGLIALLLFGVFAACVLSVLLTGADVYRRLTARDRDAYARRTCVQYVSTKVRQAQSGSALRVEHVAVDPPEGGEGSEVIDVLSFTEEYGGDLYVTSIYCWDGWLWELFTFDGADFYPEDGEKIIEARDLRLALEDGLLSVSVTDSGGTEVRLALSLRGEGAAA